MMWRSGRMNKITMTDLRHGAWIAYDKLLLRRIRRKLDEIVDWINAQEEAERQKRINDPNGPPGYE
jgi:hypothetical protein